jgi:hypothetical protein
MTHVPALTPDDHPSALHSVQFSNHTGYPVFRGEVLQGEQLIKLISVGGLACPTRAMYAHDAESLVVLGARGKWSSGGIHPCAYGLHWFGVLSGRGCPDCQEAEGLWAYTLTSLVALARCDWRFIWARGRASTRGCSMYAILYWAMMESATFR